MVRLINRLAKKNNDWVTIVKSFGASKQTAEDVVQDMYIKLDEWESKYPQSSIMYNKQEVNYYFVFKVLNSLFIDYKRKQKKFYLPETPKIFEKSNDEELSKLQFTDELKNKLSLMHWYDQRIFKIVCIEGISMLQLSELTGISYYSIKRTIKKVKKNLK